MIVDEKAHEQSPACSRKLHGMKELFQEKYFSINSSV